MVESKGENDNHRSENDGGERGLKKGPWTAGEDGILIEYVKKHGEGNWNAVQKEAGLARCGKSCRLRWANHLRPNLKKGSFTEDEESVVIKLHAKLGNKWARMAAQLPGRTDNEIKNYWNTRMKRRQRAGLPLYPLEIHQQAPSFHPRHNPSSAAATTTFRPKPDFNTGNPNSISIFNFSSTINITHMNFNDDSSFYAAPINEFNYFPQNNGGAGFALPLSPVSPFRPIGFNQSLSPPPPQLNYVSDSNSGLNSMILEAQYYNLIPESETELPSIQTPPHSTTASSGYSGGEGFLAADNSGLLDVVLMESEARSRNGKQLKEESSAGAELKCAVEQNVDAAAGENHSDGFSSSDSSSRKRPRILEPLEMNSMEDDDLMSLLDNFQSEMSVPEWYPSYGDDNLAINAHNGPSLFELINNPKRDEQHQPNANSPSTVASPVLEWSVGSSGWNNMANIC